MSDAIFLGHRSAFEAASIPCIVPPADTLSLCVEYLTWVAPRWEWIPLDARIDVDAVTLAIDFDPPDDWVAMPPAYTWAQPEGGNRPGPAYYLGDAARRSRGAEFAVRMAP